MINIKRNSYVKFFFACATIGLFSFSPLLNAASFSEKQPGEIHGFYYYFNTLYLSHDVTVPTRFGLQGKFSNHKHLRLVVDAPKGVMFDTRFKDNSIMKMAPVKINGHSYLRYQFNSRSTTTSYAAIRLSAYVKNNTDASLPIYYYAKWDGGQQPKRKLNLKIVTIPKSPQLKHIKVGLELNSVNLIENYHNFIKSFKHTGLNWVAAGPTSWSLGREERKPDDYYKSFINKMESSGLMVSTGNIGYPFNRFRQVISHTGNAYKIAGTLYHPKKQFKDFDVNDFRAVDINGKILNAMDPTYRGRFFKKAIDNVKLLIDYGYTTLLYDEETWRMPPYIGYSKRSLAKFATFLKENYPNLKPLSPKTFAETPKKYPKLMDAWWDFRTTQVAEIYKAIQKVAHQYGGPNIKIYVYVGASAWYPKGAKRYKTITHVLTDYHKMAQYVNAQLPMFYTRSLKQSKIVGDRARFLWEHVHKLSKPFMALSPARTYEYKRVASGELPPAIAIKYQMFEAFSQGTQGIIVWAPGSSLEGALSFKYMAQAIKAIAPVEYVVVNGHLLPDPKSSNSSVHARAIAYKNRAVVLVADYSPGKVTTDITFHASQLCVVKDLETGKVVGRLGSGRSTFKVTLNKRRAKLFVIE